MIKKLILISIALFPLACANQIEDFKALNLTDEEFQATVDAADEICEATNYTHCIIVDKEVGSNTIEVGNPYFSFYTKTGELWWADGLEYNNGFVNSKSLLDNHKIIIMNYRNQPNFDIPCVNTYYLWFKYTVMHEMMHYLRTEKAHIGPGNVMSETLYTLQDADHCGLTQDDVDYIMK
jgi:hypothetical protein